MKLITILTYYSRKVPSLPVIHLPRVDPYYFVSFNPNFPSIDLFSLCIYGEVWRHVTMVAKFLDLYFSFLSWQRRPFVSSNDRRKLI